MFFHVFNSYKIQRFMDYGNKSVKNFNRNSCFKGGVCVAMECQIGVRLPTPTDFNLIFVYVREFMI